LSYSTDEGTFLWYFKSTELLVIRILCSDKLKKYFKQYGSVQDAVVMKDPVSKRSRGFGFITFYDISSVDNVLANEPHTIDARKVEAKRAVPRSEMSKEVNRMGGIPPPPGGGTPASTMSKSTTNSTPVSSPLVIGGKSMSSGTSTPPSLADARYLNDLRIGSEDYAYNKVFVGGLHYDTRDRKFEFYVYFQY
jgi:RNA-binding protein Musashi